MFALDCLPEKVYSERLSSIALRKMSNNPRNSRSDICQGLYRSIGFSKLSTKIQESSSRLAAFCRAADIESNFPRAQNSK
jgi:hypothetical protein